MKRDVLRRGNGWCAAQGEGERTAAEMDFNFGFGDDFGQKQMGFVTFGLWIGMVGMVGWSGKRCSVFRLRSLVFAFVWAIRSDLEQRSKGFKQPKKLRNPNPYLGILIFKFFAFAAAKEGQGKMQT